jgi:hypothetical protein
MKKKLNSLYGKFAPKPRYTIIKNKLVKLGYEPSNLYPYIMKDYTDTDSIKDGK